MGRRVIRNTTAVTRLTHVKVDSPQKQFKFSKNIIIIPAYLSPAETRYQQPSVLSLQKVPSQQLVSVCTLARARRALIGWQP